MAREFDGATGAYHLGSGASLDDLASGAFTILATIYPETTGEGGTGRIATKREATGLGGWLFFTDGTASLGFQAVDGAAAAAANQRGSANQITLNAWNRVAVTYDNAGDRKGHIYVAGAEISYVTNTAAVAAIGSDANGNLFVGNSAEDTRTFDGFIAEVAVFNAVLSLDIITAHARGWSARMFTANRVACLDMLRDVVELHANPITSSGTHNVQPHPGFIYPGESYTTWRGAAANTTISLSDAGAGVDALGIASGVGIADAGIGADTFAPSVSVAVTDTGAAIDGLGCSATIALVDAGAGGDALSIAVALAITDAASAADVLSVIQATLITVADLAAGVDAVAVTVSVPLGDTGSGLDAVAIQALLALLDAGAGVDVVIRTDSSPGGRIARVTFTLRGRSMSFEMRSRSMTFTLQ